MGRPLNKKFFGNRNIGSVSTTSDDGIGGQGVASAAITVVGSYTTRPTFTFTAPTLPTGVTATGTINSEALSGVATTAGTGYNVGDLLTLTAADGGTATAYVATLVGGAGTGIATVNFTGTGAVRGTFQALPGAKFATGATAPNTVAKTGTGTGAEITVTFRAITGTSGVTITDSGSGYTAAPTISAYANRGGITVATIVLTTDSGNVGSATNQENAIQITAYIPAIGEAGYINGAGGSSAVAADIVRQSGSNKYVVRTAQGVGRVKLVAATPTKGQASIIATDSAGGTYYVTELRGRKAHIIKGDQTGTQFTTGTDGIDVPWTFNTTSPSTKIIDSQPYLAAGVNVQISNA